MRPQLSWCDRKQGSELGVAVLVPLHGLGIEAERHVVDEHAPVDLRQVHPALAALDQRVQTADDVVAVDAEVQGEVVASPGRDAGVGQVIGRRDLRHDRLRAVSACHGQGVGAGGDRVLDELAQVVAAPELDRLDPAMPSLRGEMKALRLATAGKWVEEQDRSPRPAGVGQVDVRAERRSGEQHRACEGGHHHEVPEQVTRENDDEDRCRQARARQCSAGKASRPFTTKRPPAGDQSDPEARQRDDPAREALDGQEHRNDKRAGPKDQRPRGCEATPGHMPHLDIVRAKLSAPPGLRITRLG